ncbi:transglutaminase domain-containing protein [Clostridium sp. LP20]|uniref:transglutaminase-like domain-containing protein n=1 Tax=Clostridium sp. LP20 TaxID=3418665 RepID=UPI003EE573A1
MKSVVSKLMENIISLLFTIIGAEVLFYSMYRRFSFICAIAIFIFVILLYTVFDIVVEQGKKGILIYLIVGIIMLGTCYIFTNQSSKIASVGFYSWVLGGGKDIGDYFGYVVGAVLFVSFIYTSLTYYFSINNMRMPMMFLLGFIVLVLYTKSVYKTNNVFISIFIFLLFALFLLSSKKKDLKWKTKVNIQSKHILTSGIGFVLIVFLIGSLIPKVKEFPKISPLEGIKELTQGFMKNNLSGIRKPFKMDGSKERDTNVSTVQNSNNILYSFTGDNPGYLVDHNMDVYKDNRWSQDYNYAFYDGYKGKNKDSIISDFEGSTLVDDTKSILKNGKKLNEELSKIKEIQEDSNLKKSLEITVENREGIEIAHPINTVLFNKEGDRNLTLYTDNFDVIYKDRDIFTNQEVLSAKYINDNPLSNSIEDKLMRYMTSDNYRDFLRSNQDLNDYTDKRNKLFMLEDRYTALDSSTTDRIFELSKDLTKDEDSIYNKAQNIESYFRSGEYIYNLTLPEQKSGDNYIDFFIFEGKEGYCVQYATAMTLLCRASGIPSRYVEGYSITEEDFDGRKYNVKESNAHAFVQVYIPGYGWKVFDPTPGLSTPKDEIINKESGVKNKININFNVIIVGTLAIILIGAAIVIYLHFTKRNRFLKKIQKYSKEERLEALIKDSIRLLEDEGMTPYDGETLLNFAKRVDYSIQIGFNEVIEEYYDFKYAFKILEASTLEKASEVNNNIYEYGKKK